jgi:hypothetical protein
MKMKFFEPLNMKQWEIKNSPIISIVLKQTSCLVLNVKNMKAVNDVWQDLNCEIFVTSQEGKKGVAFKNPIMDFPKRTVTVDGDVPEIVITLLKHNLISSEELESIFSYLEKTNGVKGDDFTVMENPYNNSETSPLIPKKLKL